MDGATQASLAAILAALVASAALADTLPSFGMFTSYQSVRQSLLRQGWLPWRLPNAGSCSPQDDRCRGRPEMLNCDAGGSATCVFTWKKGSSVIEVTTRGKGSSPGVTGVKCQSACSSPQRCRKDTRIRPPPDASFRAYAGHPHTHFRGSEFCAADEFSPIQVSTGIGSAWPKLIGPDSVSRVNRLFIEMP